VRALRPLYAFLYSRSLKANPYIAKDSKWAQKL